ncbi:MAG: CcmD family protein [Bacteroidota bacterium]
MDNQSSFPGNVLESVTSKRFKSLAQALSFITFFTLLNFSLFAQATEEKVQMAEGLRSNGKIYVVVAVLLTVLAGLIFYVIRLDKRISRMEQQSKA